MIGSISQESASSNGLRVNGQARTGGKMSVADTSQAATGTRKQGVSENFKSALTARVERYQNSGQSEKGGTAENGKALVDSVAQAAAEIKTIYGQDAANAFMANVLKGVDEKGFNQESLTKSVSTALKDVAQCGSSSQLQKLTESFNQGLGAADNPDGRAVKGLSQAVNDFFGLEKQETKNGQTAQGFTANGNWGEVAVEDAGSGPLFVQGTPEVAQSALEASASFQMKAIGQDTKDDLVNYLREELGAEEAAAFLESAPGKADFMSTMDHVIELALKEADGSENAAKLENYLNDQVVMAVNASSEANRNPFGYVEFEGWDLKSPASGGTSVDGEKTPATFSSKWRYTNRDDVSYVRTGQAQAKPKEGGENAEESTGSAMGDMLKKMNEKYIGKTGEMVDTTA